MLFANVRVQVALRAVLGDDIDFLAVDEGIKVVHNEVAVDETGKNATFVNRLNCSILLHERGVYLFDDVPVVCEEGACLVVARHVDA